MALMQPKKPVGGAFGIFTNEKRAEFTKLCTGQKASAVAKLAGEEWKKLSEAERGPYQKKYEEAKAQYDKDMSAFIENGGEKSKGIAKLRSEKKAIKEGKKAKKERDADAPKRLTGGAYGRFLADKREEIKGSLPTGHKMTDITKKAGEMFKALSESEKQKYQAMFEAAQEDYKKELEVYTANKKVNEPEKTEVQKSPTKRQLQTPENDAKPAKRGRKVATPMSKQEASVELNEEVLGKARAAGFESELKNLASRPDVVTSGKVAYDLFKALQKSNGLVNSAKRLLLDM